MVTPHLFTLTGNLLAERTLEFDRWTPGKTQRASHELFQVGGKGINVSKMLMRLGVSNTALCFAGGASGAECERWLRGNNFTFRAFATDLPTRTGTVIRDRSEIHPETTFLSPDVAPDETAIRKCADYLDQQPSGRVIALCGSFPGWSTPPFVPLREALRRWQDRGSVVVDTYGPPLKELVTWPLALLKINADELRMLSPQDSSEMPSSPLRVVITDGPGAVRIRERHHRQASFQPPSVTEVSSTGSGDVFLACLMERLFLREIPLENAVTFAMRYAAANAAHPRIAEFPLPDSSS